MSLVKDIVDDYNSKIKRGASDVYYKKDVIQGIKLIMTIVGIIKLVTLVGGTVVAAIGSLASFAVNNPQGAIKLGQLIGRNSENILKIVSGAGNTLNDGYKKLSVDEKKMVRTVVLLVVKGGLNWEDLH